MKSRYQKLKNIAWIFIVLVALVIGYSVGKSKPIEHIHVITGAEAYFTPGVQCENRIVEEIAKAQTIDIAVYSITNKKITSALLNAKKRGARIRVVTDRTMAGNKYSKDEVLLKAGIPLRKNKKHKIEHNKFAVFDGSHIVTGSYNWTDAATKSNSENCVFLDALAEDYSARFEYLWNLYQN